MIRIASYTLTPEQALSRPRRLRVQTVLGVSLLAVALAGGLAIGFRTTTASAGRGVVVLTRDLPAGATLGAGDLAITNARLDDAVYTAAVPAGDQATLVGTQLLEPAHARQILVRSQLSSRLRLAPDQVALTIPITPASAVSGQLHPGDTVAILLTMGGQGSGLGSRGAGNGGASGGATANGGAAQSNPDSRPLTVTSGAATTTIVLPRVRVLTVGRDDRSLEATASSAQTSPVTRQQSVVSLTLALTSEQAVILANARHSGDLDVALVPPDALGDGRGQ